MVQKSISSCQNIDPVPVMTDVNSLRLENVTLQEENQKLRQRVEQLSDYLRQERQHRFGRKSEKLVSANAPMFPELEQVFDEEMSDPTKEEAPKEKKPRKAAGFRKPLPEDLPREEVIHDLSEAERTCACGYALHPIGSETSEQLEVIPAKIKVLRHVRIKYGCKACEETVTLAKMPAQPLPKSMAAPGLLSHIVVSKYDDHLPLYRQAEIWQRSGITLDRATLGRWMRQCGTLLQPLVDLMRKDIVSGDYIQADETGVQVMKEPGRKNTTKSYMWAYKTGGPGPFKIVYVYSPHRYAAVAQEFLGTFKGYLQTDRYSGYKTVCSNSKGTIHSVACLAHARRKFVDVAKGMQKPGVSTQVLELMGQLYKIEQQGREKGLDPGALKKLRQKEAKPILDTLKDFLLQKRPHIPPKSLLGEAVRYTLTHFKELCAYLEDGRLAIDNNDVERCIRPFAVGRKNWLFSGSVQGAQASAALYSLLETAKSYGHNPFLYFKDVLKNIAGKDKGDPDLKKLLPYNWKPPVDKPSQKNSSL
jgi:transposase